MGPAQRRLGLRRRCGAREHEAEVALPLRQRHLEDVEDHRHERVVAEQQDQLDAFLLV